MKNSTKIAWYLEIGTCNNGEMISFHFVSLMAALSVDIGTGQPGDWVLIPSRVHRSVISPQHPRALGPTEPHPLCTGAVT